MKKKKTKRFKDILFYVILVSLLVGIFFLTRDEHEAGAPGHVMGFSVMRVLTGSMESVLPQGSLILTRRVDTAEIQVGDDITFLVSEHVTVTHRVVDIIENHNDTGQRGFKTQGTENPSPDRQIVIPNHIIGRVIWHSPFLGMMAGHIETGLEIVTDNIFLFGGLAIILVALIVTLRIAFKPKGEEERNKEQQVDAILQEIIHTLEAT